MRDEIFSGGKYVPTKEEKAAVARLEREVLIRLQETELYIEKSGYKHYNVEDMTLAEYQSFNKGWYENGKYDHLMDGTKTFYEVIGIDCDNPTGYIGVTAVNGKLISIDIYEDSHFQKLDRTISVCEKEIAEKAAPITNRGSWEMPAPITFELDPEGFSPVPDKEYNWEKDKEQEEQRESYYHMQDLWNVAEHIKGRF